MPDQTPQICRLNCAVATAVLISMIYKMFSIDKSQIMTNFTKTLTSNLREKYQKIILERRNIYFQGYALGFAISLFVIYNNYIKLSSSRTKNQALSKFSLVCTVVSVTFIVSYFHYILHPKSDWMVKYLTTNQQKDAWLKIYRHMQLNSHIGAALGIVAVALYANSVCPHTAD